MQLGKRHFPNPISYHLQMQMYVNYYYWKLKLEELNHLIDDKSLE